MACWIAQLIQSKTMRAREAIHIGELWSVEYRYTLQILRHNHLANPLHSHAHHITYYICIQPEPFYSSSSRRTGRARGRLYSGLARSSAAITITLGTVGDHIRKKRMDMDLYQREVAEIISAPEATGQMWECYGYEPRMRYWPGVISFLGYEPYSPPRTMSEKVEVIRRRFGLTSRELAQRIQADPGAITRWETGGAIRKERHRRAIAELCETLCPSENQA